MASQFQIYMTMASPLLFIWTLILLNFFAMSEKTRKQVLVGAPLLVVFTLGIYAVGSVIYGVITFNDCKAAKQDLIKEIAEAKADLRKRKIID